MPFTDVSFLFLLFPVSLAAYYLLGKKLRNFVLVVFSMMFYLIGGRKMILVLAASITVNYLLALLMEKSRKRKPLLQLELFVMLIWNCGLLFYFKYLTFAVSTIKRLIPGDFSVPVILLPVGISFFTFRAISYLLDVYHASVPAEKNLINVALYISFFPQVCMGPITKYSDFAPQLQNRVFDFDQFSEGTMRITVGLCKKVIIADSLAPMVNKVFDMPMTGRSVLLAWLGIIGYTVQLYFDFSGYSDIAIGIGMMFGFKSPENFNYPYVSTSVKEFWRRWHISLSTWFRDYVYIPLGGSRCKKRRNYLNLFLVFLLTGIWHGASFNFFALGYILCDIPYCRAYAYR